MEDGLSTIIPSSLNFDLPIDTNHCEEEEAEAVDALKRDKQIEQSFEDAFRNLNVSDDDDSSDGESVAHSQSYEHTSHASVKPPFKYPFLPNETDHHSSSVSHSHSDHLVEQSVLSDSGDSHHAAPDHSNSHSDFGVSVSQESNRNSPRYNSNVIENGNHHSGSYKNSNASDNANYRKDIVSNEFVSNISENYGTKSFSSTTTSALHSLQPIGTQEEYIKQIQILYDTRGQELEQIKREQIRAKEHYECEINNLNIKLLNVESENNKLSTAFTKSEILITDYKHDNTVLKGKLAALEVQLNAEKQAKESALGKLESYEITIQSLEQQINDFTRSENARRLQDQNERVIKDLKLRHQKEILHLKEEIDKLHENLGDKITDFEKSKSELSRLQKECEELQMEKSTMFNNLSTNLKLVQKEYQEVLESGNRQAKEISTLKRQNQTLQEAKSKLEKQNSALKGDIKVLESEIRASEALKKVEHEIEVSQADPQSSRKAYSQKESSLKRALQQSLKNEQSVKDQNHSLLEKLDDLKNQLAHWEEKAKLFESRFNESAKKAEELEKKLEDVLPDGSIPVAEHEKKLNSLKIELIDLQKKFHDVSERSKFTSSNEKALSKENKKLKSKITEMLEEHSSEKIKAVEECREKYIQLHQSAVKKLNEELTSKAEEELKLVCGNYNNKIAQLEKEVKSLSDGLYEAKSQYITIFDENKSLQSKLESISKPKDQQDVEKELHAEYGKKLNEMKEQIQKQRNYFEHSLKNEIERVQEEWTKQKMVEIKEFIDSTKQCLDEEFIKCVAKEKNKFQSDLTSEKEKIIAEYQEKINVLKHQCEADKENLNTKLRESFQIKWKSEIKELQQGHQQEIQSIKQKYENTISMMTHEIETLKEKQSRNSSEREVIGNLKKEVEKERQAWESERSELISSEQSVKEKLARAVDKEKKLHDKVKRYQKYSASLEKKYQEKMNQLIRQNDELYKSIVDKEKELLALKEKFEEDIFEMEKKCNKQIVGRNMGSQTEEQVVSRKSFLNAQDMFIQCLKKIADEVKTYLLNSRKRTAEQLQKALYYYHDQLTSKVLQDVFKGTSPFPSSVYIPHINLNSQSSVASKQDDISPSTVQQQFNADYKISNSTPIDRLASGDTHNRLELYRSDENTAKIFHNMKLPGNGHKFEDISFDFVPIKMPDSAFMSTKLPDYPVPRGLFNQENILKNSYPERPSPISSIK